MIVLLGKGVPWFPHGATAPFGGGGIMHDLQVTFLLKPKVITDLEQ